MEENLTANSAGGKFPYSQFKMFFCLLFSNHKWKLKMFARFLPPSPPNNTFFGYGPVVLTNT